MEKNDNKKQYNISIDKGIMKTFDNANRRSGRTRSASIEILIRKFLKGDGK